MRNPVSAETPRVSKAIGETPHICEFKLPAIIQLIQTGRLTYSNLIRFKISVNIPSAITPVFRWLSPEAELGLRLSRRLYAELEHGERVGSWIPCGFVGCVLIEIQVALKESKNLHMAGSFSCQQR